MVMLAIKKLIQRQPKGVLKRGESAIASTGLAIAAILLGFMAATAWWTENAQQNDRELDHRTKLEAVGSLLAQTAEILLSADELSAARRLISDVAQQNQLQSCRIVMGDGGGGVLADADASRITVHEIPANLRGDAALGDVSAEAIESEVIEGALTLRYPLEIANAKGSSSLGRAAAILEIASIPSNRAWSFSEAQAGLGAIGAVSLIALLVVYRRTRSRLRAMGTIRESLLALQRGEAMPEALAVHSDGSQESSAWNQLLEQLAGLRKQLIAENVVRTGDSRRSGGGGVGGGSDLENVCDAMWQGLMLVDDQGRIKYANGAAAVLLRGKREEMVGKKASIYVTDPAVQKLVNAVVEGTLRRRSTVEVKQQADSATGGGGEGVLRFGVRPVRQGDSAAAMLIIDDVTQQRLAEEARNTFVAQATHELRMPLTNIRLYAESALDEGERDQVVRAKCLNVINQESRRLERIVGDMLSVAEIEAGTLKLRQGDVRLDTLFEELQADYQAQAHEKSITLTFALPPKLPAIKGDRDKIVLALHNLIGNGIKYTPAGGTVTVRVEIENGNLVAEVTDTGIGIPEEEVELIFEKFYRSKDKRLAGITGSGLGLTLAREVIRLHRGDITVRSQIDQGSSFTLTVPTLTTEAA